MAAMDTNEDICPSPPLPTAPAAAPQLQSGEHAASPTSSRAAAATSARGLVPESVLLLFDSADTSSVQVRTDDPLLTNEFTLVAQVLT